MDLFIGWLYLELELKRLNTNLPAFAQECPSHFMMAWSAWNAPSEPS